MFLDAFNTNRHRRLNASRCNTLLRLFGGPCLLLIAAQLAAGEYARAEGGVVDRSLQFVGRIERDNLHHVAANTRGTVESLNLEFGQVIRRGDALFTIRPSDPGFAKSIVLAGFDRGTVVEKLAENGHFVEVNKLLLKVAVDEAYKVIINVPAHEVRYFKAPAPMELELYAPRGRNVKLRYADVSIRPPRGGGALYQIELQIDCEQFACATYDLAGALARINLHAAAPR